MTDPEQLHTAPKETDECPVGDPDGRSYYMYVVACADGSLYTGYAVDVERRVAQHNAGQGAKYTRSRRPVRLVARACFDTQHEALSAEYHFKRLPREQKLRLIERSKAACAEDEASDRSFARLLNDCFSCE